MALTITWEGIGVIANASSTTESIGLGTNQWNEDGAGSDSWTTDTFLQGGESFAGAYSNKAGFQYYQTATSYSFAASGNAEGQFIYIWVNCPTIGLLQTLANKGLAIRIGTSLTAYNDYTIAGSNDANGWLGDWKCFVIDPTKTATATGGGGATLSNINFIGVYIDTAAIAKGDNIFIDQIAIGTGLRVTGTSTTGWQDIKSYVSAYATRAWGVYDARDKWLGKIYIGDSTQTAITQFSDSGQTIEFGYSEYYNGSGWVSSVPTDAFGIVLDDATGFRTEFTDGIAVGSDNGRSGSTFIGNDNENIIFDASSLSHADSFVKLYSTVFRKFAGGVKLHNDSDSLFYGGTVTKSGQFDPVGAPVIRNCIFSETTHNAGTADGAALLWNSNINIQACSFIANVDDNASFESHAIQHTVSGSVSYNNLTFSGNEQEILFTAASGDLTIGASNGTNVSNTLSDHTITGTGTIIVNNEVQLTITGLVANSEITIVRANTQTAAQSNDGSDHIENSGTSHIYKFNYPPSGYTDVDIFINKPGYVWLPIRDYTLGSSNGTLPVSQRVDKIEGT